jgi:predicted nucleic acid-binding protein
LALVVDASVGLKWVLEEPDSHLAEALVRIEPDLLVPDFWLNEASNVLWLQVRRNLFTPEEARDGLTLLRAQVEPTPTADMRLHEVALDIGIATHHSTYDTMYLAFAIATGARAVVAADGPFVRSMQTHPDATLSAMMLSLEAWAESRGAGERQEPAE